MLPVWTSRSSGPPPRAAWTTAALAFLLAVPGSVLPPTEAGAQPSATSPLAADGATARELVVATRVAAPFVLRQPDGGWTGLSIELWERIAATLGWSYRYEERDLTDMLAGVENGTIDVAVAALTVTAAREEQMDFTHPFHSSGLGIAVPAARRSAWLSLVHRLVSSAFVQAAGGLLTLLLLVGWIVWLVERRHNPGQFAHGWRGLGAGLWWSAVTMTTVGYGDKAPETLAGRTLAIIWMFASVALISGFTAAIASSLTIGELESRIQGPDDLTGKRVGTVAASTSDTWLADRQIAARHQPTIADAVRALARGELDAVVYDAPILMYLAQTKTGGAVRVLPRLLEHQDYAFALRSGSALREPLNQELLRQLAEPAWDAIRVRYLGE
ncbi:MAG: transporter substrate-binding domain-containing protein [Candidatus Eiseniibacteriota bacterium]|jgi:ABC-type amino acid transport substrate-binding protein